MSEKKLKELEKKGYEPPKLISLGEIDQSIGYSCTDGTDPVIACSGGSWDGGNTCMGGFEAVLGGCYNGFANSTPY